MLRIKCTLWQQWWLEVGGLGGREGGGGGVCVGIVIITTEMFEFSLQFAITCCINVIAAHTIPSCVLENTPYHHVHVPETRKNWYTLCVPTPPSTPTPLYTHTIIHGDSMIDLGIAGIVSLQTLCFIFIDNTHYVHHRDI